MVSERSYYQLMDEFKRFPKKVLNIGRSPKEHFLVETKRGEKMNKISERLRVLRVDNGKTKEELAIYLGITVAAYSRYETGTRLPDIDSLIKLAIFYNVTLDSLLGRDDIEMPVFEREQVVSYKDLVELGMNGKLAHGIISEIDKSKPFEERIRSSLEDKTKYVTKEEVREYLKKVYDMI